MTLKRKILSYFISTALMMTVLPTQNFAQHVNENLALKETSMTDMTTPQALQTDGYHGEDYSIVANITSQWADGFIGEIRITNHTPQPIEDWILSFDFEASIESFWTAEIIAHEANRYIIQNKGYNAKIAPGETLVLGFIGNSGEAINVPTHYLLEQLGQDVEGNAAIEGEQAIDDTQDTDGDALPDCYESVFGTEKDNGDTDGDGLPDGYEVFVLGTNPLLSDTNSNGLSDGEEDLDEDGLSNSMEYHLGINPKDSDTDSDHLSDREEVNTYNTNPLAEDTDADGLIDGDEIQLGFSPLAGDTDSNGVGDNKEKVLQVLTKALTNSEKPQLKSIAVQLSCAGLIEDVISIHETYDQDLLSSHVIGLVGSPVVISLPKATQEATQEGVQEEAEEATITFIYDEQMLEGTQEEDLAVMWYDEVSHTFEFLEEASHVDTQNDTVTYSGPCGRTYLLVDQKAWCAAWESKGGSSPVSLCYDLEDTTIDTDGDGLSDSIERAGVQIQTGEIITTDPLVADTDGDGLSDGEELGMTDKMRSATYSQGANLVTISLSNPNVADSDYDGKYDDVDTQPNNNTFSGTLHTDYADAKVAYTMDYREFFKANTTYSKKIGTISSLYASVVYDGNTYGGKNIKQFMTEHGLTDIVQYDLHTMYGDSDVSEAYIGHRKVTYNNESREVVAIVVRGTNGTIEEWSSNFDIGTTTQKSSYADWSVSSNHKGFDSAATRILKCLTAYENAYDIGQTATPVYWVMGHSRGAAIANIIGARLVDQSKEVYAYTFAAPNTTTAKNAGSYAGIYNILNADDFVPYLPMSAWGFTHYGKSAVISIANQYEEEWEDLTGCKNRFGVVDYNIDAIGMEDTIEKISDIVSNRNQCYVYTCDCHGDGSLDEITITNRGMSKSSREEAIAKIPDNALPYCKITRYNGGLVSGWDFTVCQQPEYFMQVLAAYMAGDINEARFAVELNIANRYESAKSAIVSSGLGGLEHPHYTESYYLLATHVTNSSF